jgi:hypothetical protein
VRFPDNRDRRYPRCWYAVYGFDDIQFAQCQVLVLLVCVGELVCGDGVEQQGQWTRPHEVCIGTISKYQCLGSNLHTTRTDQKGQRHDQSASCMRCLQVQELIRCQSSGVSAVRDVTNTGLNDRC